MARRKTSNTSSSYPANFMEAAQLAWERKQIPFMNAGSENSSYSLLHRFNRFRNCLVDEGHEFALAAKDLIARRMELQPGVWVLTFEAANIYEDGVFKPGTGTEDFAAPLPGQEFRGMPHSEVDETEAKMEALIFGRKLEENANVQEAPRVEQVALAPAKAAPQLGVEEITRALAADEATLQGEKRIEACGLTGHAWETYGSCEKCGVSKAEWESGSWKAK